MNSPIAHRSATSKHGFRSEKDLFSVKMKKKASDGNLMWMRISRWAWYWWSRLIYVLPRFDKTAEEDERKKDENPKCTQLAMKRTSSQVKIDTIAANRNALRLRRRNYFVAHNVQTMRRGWSRVFQRKHVIFIVELICLSSTLRLFNSSNRSTDRRDSVRFNNNYIVM